MEIFDKVSWSLVVAANSEALLQNNLLKSGEAKFAKEIIVQRDATNAAAAYNAGLSQSSGEVVVLAHQDVFLPPGWARKLNHYLGILSEKDPHWGVAGLYGITESGNGAGHVYSLGLKRFVGKPFSEPIQVSTIDEMALIIRRTANLRFDERLPGFHLYGTDICMEAAAQGWRNYVIPCFAVHNSRGIKRLPLDFWRAYLYLRRKWRDRLPIATPCTTISSGFSPIFEHLLTTCWSSVRGRNNPGSRVDDPERFYKEYIAVAINSSF